LNILPSGALRFRIRLSVLPGELLRDQAVAADVMFTIDDRHPADARFAFRGIAACQRGA
jgi:hypothetical protein